MELLQHLRTIQRYWRSVLAVTLVALCLAALTTLLQRPQYSSTASLFLSVQSGETAGELSQGATYAERQVKSFVNVATTSVVLQPVIDELGLGMTPANLARDISVGSPLATSIIDVTARRGNAAEAARLTDSVARHLMSAVEDLSPSSANPDVRLVSATVIEPASVPSAPTSPRPSVYLLIGLAVGLALGVAQALIRAGMDSRVRTAADVKGVTDAPLLASVSYDNKKGADGGAESARVAEAYRRLRTNIGFVGLGGERRSTIVLTSSLGGEGKTETSVNLARVLAQAGESVILVDADMRRPQVAPRLGVDAELGLSDVLTGRGELQSLVISAAPSLDVLTAGTLPPNPSELLASESMASLIRDLEERYDYVLFDSPPLLPVTDAAVLGARCGGAVLVARSGQVRRQQLREAREALEAGNVALLGVVLNDVPINAVDYYGSDGYYSAAVKAPLKAAGHRPSRAVG